MDTGIIVIWIGALLVIGGVLYMAGEAIWRRRLSGPTRTSEGLERDTLEPRRQGVGFLDLSRSWPGIALFVVGAALLLLGGAF